ncbi:hypothetical protein HZS_416 [Henneguya salminicola]|nr:hypothetical protein HZS_416 [Henneguya salminicola]
MEDKNKFRKTPKSINVSNSIVLKFAALPAGYLKSTLLLEVLYLIKLSDNFLRLLDIYLKVATMYMTFRKFVTDCRYKP